MSKCTHSSVLAWRTPGMGKPGGLPDVYGVAQSRTRLKQLSSSSRTPEEKGDQGLDLPGRSWPGDITAARGTA